MKSDVSKLLGHEKLNQLDMKKVSSHVQRNRDGWVVNTLMLEGYDVPFKYRRKQKYRDLKGAWVNLTYYTSTDVVAGINFEVMKVVRIRRA